MGPFLNADPGSVVYSFFFLAESNTQVALVRKISWGRAEAPRTDVNRSRIFTSNYATSCVCGPSFRRKKYIYFYLKKKKKTLPQCSDNGCGAHAVISAQRGGQRFSLPALRQRRGTRDVTSAVLTAAGGRADGPSCTVKSTRHTRSYFISAPRFLK